MGYLNGPVRASQGEVDAVLRAKDSGVGSAVLVKISGDRLVGAEAELELGLGVGRAVDAEPGSVRRSEYFNRNV